MPYRPQIDDHGVVTRYKDTDTGEMITPKELERRLMIQQGGGSLNAYPAPYPGQVPQLVQTQAGGPGDPYHQMAPNPYRQMAPNPYSQGPAPGYTQGYAQGSPSMAPSGGYGGGYGGGPAYGGQPQQSGLNPAMPMPQQGAMPPMPGSAGAGSSLIQPGAQMLAGGAAPSAGGGGMPSGAGAPGGVLGNGSPPTEGKPMQGKNLRLEGNPNHVNSSSVGYKTHGFLDATSIAILLPTMVLLALIIAAAHKKRLFPWQTIRTFNPPSGMLTPRDYERSFVCPPNLRRHGRLGKRNPKAAWTEQDGVVLPFGFLARTHLPITIPLGRLPNKNMFIVAPSGSGKTTLMRAIIKALMAKPCVLIALEAKANDPNLDEKREGFKYSVLPEAQQAGFETLYFNPLDADSVHWNPLDLDPITFASSICQDVNSLPPEEQHWAERDHGYISGLAQLLRWGAVAVSGEDEQGQPTEIINLQSNPRGLMRLVNSRRNIVESLRRAKNNPEVPAAELSEMTQALSSIIRTDTDWDKNIQGVRGRLRMFKNPGVLRVTDQSNIDIRQAMHRPTVLIFGAPASMGPDAESLASCFVYQLQQALHTRYGTKSVLPLFAFFDEYQTLNMDIAGRLSAIVRGANGGLTVILQNISQIAKDTGSNPTAGGAGELKTIFSNSAIRVCLHNSDQSTSQFFSDEIGKHAVIVPGISDRYEANGFGIFPTAWNRIHSQQVVARVDTDSIKRMEKHHALVYLSPAGDPEFGEMKPFMCDLRGIEEIARLHLLHNVTGRSPSGELEDPAALAGVPGGGMPGGVPGLPGGMPGGVAAHGQGPVPAMLGAGPAPGMPMPAGLPALPAPGGAANGAVPGGTGGGAPNGFPGFARAAGNMIGSAVAAAVPAAAAMGGPAGAAAPLVAGAAGAVAQGLAQGVAAGVVQGAVQGAMRGGAPGHGQPAANPMLPYGGIAAPAPVAGTAGGAIGAPGAPGVANVGGVPAKPPFPGFGQPAPGVAAAAPGSAPGRPLPAGVAAAAPVPVPSTPLGAPVQAGVPTAAPAAGPTTGSPEQRLCGKCKKWPGKGRFCIECGTFVGQSAPANAPAGTAPAAVPAGPITAPPYGTAPTGGAIPVPNQMASPQPAQGQAAGQAGRRPLTTLHGDITQLPGLGGVPKQPDGAQPGPPQPGQTPVPRPQRGNTGIEF